MSFTAERTVHVTVRRLANFTDERLELSLAVGPQTHASQVKAKVAVQWGVPARFQRLSIGNEVLGEEAPLLPWCQGSASELHITMEFLHDEAMYALKDSESMVRAIAAETLGKASKAHGERTIIALAKCSQDADYEVRRRCVQALAPSARAHDLFARRALMARAGDPHVGVRRSVLETLASGASADGSMEQDVLDVFVDFWSDDDAVIRGAAVDAVVNLASETQVLDMVARHRDHSNSDVRVAAVEVLGRRFKRGEETALEMAISLLQDDDWSVRRSAIKALSKVARMGDEMVIQILLNSLEDPEEFVRVAAMQVLGMLALSARPGNDEVLALMAKRGRDAGSLMRHAAQSALDAIQVGCSRYAGHGSGVRHEPEGVPCDPVK